MYVNAHFLCMSTLHEYLFVVMTEVHICVHVPGFSLHVPVYVYA